MSAITRNVLLAALLCLTLGSAYASVTVSLTSPTSGAVANANGSLTVSATAVASQGYAVSKVEFFLGTTLIGTATTSPYSIEWYVGQQPGNYSLTAKATATKGSSTQTATSSAVAVTVNGGPTVSVSVTPNQAAFGYPPAVSVTVTANVSDPDGISSVYFQATGYFGENFPVTLTQPPYTVTWELGPMLPGYLPYSFGIDVVATDSRGANGFAGTTVVLTSPPTVSITAPIQNANFTPPASITVTANAADSDGSVSKVDFFANGNAIGTATSAPFSINWSNVAAGTYNLTARATDDLGVQTTSAAVPIIVNAAPSIVLTSPSQSATFRAPASITLTAQASDSDGTLASVSFYNGATLITTITTPPYTFNWTGVPQGSYSLTAVATDNVGAITTSAPVVATVNAAVAQLYFISVDHLNTPRIIADANQQTVWKWDNREPFGDDAADENPSGGGAFEFGLRFAGQYADKETSRHYNYFRNYDPARGGYIESDPIGLDGGPNTYAYVQSNPLSYNDPFGLLLTALHMLSNDPEVYQNATLISAVGTGPAVVTVGTIGIPAAAAYAPGAVIGAGIAISEAPGVIAQAATQPNPLSIWARILSLALRRLAPNSAIPNPPTPTPPAIIRQVPQLRQPVPPGRWNLPAAGAAVGTYSCRPGDRP